ncbi:MAG: cytochrome c [Mariniphaga sp.]|nr:cytochrome c [Mariniphaga sp.]
MYSKNKPAFFFTVILIVVFGCSQALYIPTFADSQNAGVSTDTLALGRKLYVNNCGSCHSLYLPAQYTKNEWVKVMPEMQKKANCNDQQVAIITKYLKARSRQE